MSIPEWDEIGIPVGYGPERLVYNAASETIIIELRSVGQEFSPNRVYMRKIQSPRYEPIRPFEPMEGCHSFVTSSERPTLFYLSERVTKRDDYYGGDWLGLYAFDIVSRTETKIVDEDTLILPAPYHRGWVSALVSASEDGKTLTVIVGMTVENHSPGFQMVNYQLAYMDLGTKHLHFISQLKGAFF